MLNKKKYEQCLKLQLWKKHHGEELQKAREYYRSDYVAVQLLKNACYLTVAYMIGLLLWGVANMDMLIEKLNRMQIKGILTGVIVSYLLCMTAGLLLTYVITMKRYFYGQELFRHYQVLLQRLEDEDDIEILEVTDLRRKKEGIYNIRTLFEKYYSEYGNYIDAAAKFVTALILFMQINGRIGGKSIFEIFLWN